MSRSPLKPRDCARPVFQPLHACEPLEHRRLLCFAHGSLAPPVELPAIAFDAAPGTLDGAPEGGPADIVWVNRLFGDNFSIYGANEVLARSIVDRAIGDWERVVQSFNYSGGSTTFNLTLTAESGFPGSANITHVDAQGKPRAATVKLDDFGGGGQPWYFDPVPGTSAVPDDAEFDEFVTPFNNDDGPFQRLDFYMVALHEIGHSLGVASGGGLAVDAFINFNNLLVDPNNPGDMCSPPNAPACDPMQGGDPGNHLYPVNFNGGAIDYTMTDAGGPGWPNLKPSHLYEGPAVGGWPIHPNDLMDDGRTLNFNFDQRRLISDTSASFLRDIYGYTITLPSQINTFYANLDTTTDILRVQGDPGNAVDFITIDSIGSDLRVQVNGTSERIPISEVSIIRVRSEGGADLINLFGIPSGISVDVASFNGAKVINVGNGDVDNEVRGPVTISGIFDPYTVRVFDQNDTGNDSYTVTNSSITKPGTLFGGVTFDSEAHTIILTANEFDNTINIESLSGSASLTVNGRGGSDTIVVGGQSRTVGNSINGNLTINAGIFGNDRVIFDDSAGAGQDIYLLNGGNYQQTGTQVFTFNDAERVELRANDENNGIAVANTFGYELTIVGNGGDDFIDIGFGVLAATGNTTVFGGAGDDTLRLNDTTTFAPTTFLANQTGGLPFVDLFNGSQLILYDSIGTLIIDAGNFNDSITSIAVPMGTTLRINGGRGDDFIDVQGHPTLNPALLPRVVVDGGGGSDTVEVNTDGQGGVRALFEVSQTLTRLALGTNGRLRLAEGGNVIDVLTSVAMPANGFELDLTDGYFVRRGNPSFDFYNSRVAVGYNGGAWNGLGINSSTAALSTLSDGIGLARASDLFGGVGGTIDDIILQPNDILMRYTLNGDADLNGMVNLADFNRVAANFGATGTSWSQGNFNYDNVTNLADFNLLAGNFGQSLGRAPMTIVEQIEDRLPTEFDLLRRE